MLDSTARTNEVAAKRVKARIERTTLRNVADLVASCGGSDCCVEIRYAMKVPIGRLGCHTCIDHRLRHAAVAKLCLPPINAATLRDAILAHPRSKIKVGLCFDQPS